MLRAAANKEHVCISYGAMMFNYFANVINTISRESGGQSKLSVLGDRLFF